MKIRNVAEKTKIDLQMVPMIDIVFQLLIFFIMTFKVVQMEGDFNIKMPSAAPSSNAMDEELLPPLKLRLFAGEGGRLAGIELNQQDFASFAALHEHIVRFVAIDAGPTVRAASAEIEIDADYDLNYEYVIAAITAVTGHRDEDGTITPLIEKIKFSPAKSKQDS